MLAAAAVVACALNLLGRTEAIVPIKLLTVPPPEASATAEAFVARDPPAIYLITSTAAFRDAQSEGSGHLDGCRKVASMIVHEEWHLRHGADEQGAYYAQITALAAMGASTVQIADVRRSMFAVLRTPR
jgi:hypothetical protein